MANQHIKGITVEIGGDTSELSQALKGVDKDARRISDELKSVNAALKVDPSSVVALTQKQELLAQSIENTKKKIDILKKAEADAQKQLAKGEIGQDQYRALQREVVFAEGKLKKLERQLEDTKKAAQAEGDAVEKAGKDAEKASQKNKELGKSLDGLKQDYDKAKSSAKDAAKELGTGLAAGAAVGTAAVMQAMSYADALDAIRMQTGASEEAMASYELAMKAVFDSGLGENLDDVASTMAIIAQQTHETDPSKLETMAKNALILKDNLGFEIAEQLRTVNMLTSQFGIDEEAAYNLIVQGAQKGLNQNGDMLDILNEYAVHYKNLGYGPEAFLNSLANGAATGVFSVDNLGDAMKEFGIKTKDETATTTEAYEILNLNADEMRKKFAQGGEAAQEAAKEVNDALFSMDDEVARNTVGVGLYGTMWEDLGKDAIRALTDTTGEISAAGDAMERVRDIKLDATSVKWSKLGRTVQTELLLPFGEKLLPTVTKLCNYAIKNADELLPMIKNIATILASMWAGRKIGNAIQNVIKIVNAYKALKTATTAANAAMTATPWGAVGTAVGAVVGGVISLVNRQNEAEAAAKKLREELDAQTQSYWDVAAALEESVEERAETVDAIDDEFAKVHDLWKELELLVDSEGRVIEGNEDRVKQINGELSTALGSEISLVDCQIQKYGELRNSIEDVIAIKKAERMLNVLSADYETAKKDLPELQSTYEQNNATWYEYKRRQEEFNKDAEFFADYQKVQEQYPVNPALLGIDPNESGIPYYSEVELAEMRIRHDDNKKWLDEHANAKENLEASLFAYDLARMTIGEYEALEYAIYSNDYSAVKTATDQVGQGILTAESGAAQSSLEHQLYASIERYAEMLEQSQLPGSTITQDQLKKQNDLMMSALEEVKESAQDSGNDYNNATLKAGFADYMLNNTDGAVTIPDAYGTLSTVGILRRSPRKHNVMQGFIDATAENQIPYDLSTPAAEAARQSNTLLNQILRRIEELDLKIVLDDGTVAGRTDKHLGTSANDEKRGAFK